MSAYSGSIKYPIAVKGPCEVQECENTVSAQAPTLHCLNDIGCYIYIWINSIKYLSSNKSMSTKGTNLTILIMVFKHVLHNI